MPDDFLETAKDKEYLKVIAGLNKDYELMQEVNKAMGLNIHEKEDQIQRKNAEIQRLSKVFNEMKSQHLKKEDKQNEELIKLAEEKDNQAKENEVLSKLFKDV